MDYNNLPLDANGFPFSKPSFRLDPREYAKIVSEINNKYEIQYKDMHICVHTSFGIDGIAYNYWFENHGFNNYNIYFKTVDLH